MIELYKSQRKKSKSKIGKPVSVSSINRELACLSHMFTLAIEWQRVNNDPTKKIKKYKEPNGRLRYLEESEIERLLLCSTPHIRPILLTALNTGMRLREILGLKWENIDFRRGIIYVEHSKNGERREIPINRRLTEGLRTVKTRFQEGTEYVYTNSKGKPLRDVRTAFSAGLDRAGIKNFRFHDLRHTFASHLVLKGVDLLTVKELLGHKTLAVTLRYAHLSPSHKRNAVSVLDVDTNMDTKSISDLPLAVST